MKNAILSFWLIAVLVLFSNARSLAQYHLGVRAGVNFSNFKPGAFFDYDTRVGANVALLINRPLNKVLSIQLEPGFSQRGARYETLGEGPLNGAILKSEERGKFRFNFIELPVLLQWRPQIGKFTGIVSLGPELRYLAGHVKLKYSSKITYDGVVTKDESGVVNLESGYGKNTFDYGAVGGLGMGYPVKSVTIFGEARYHLGLRRLAEGVKTYHRGPSVHIGVLVPMGK
ncbi:hypothetical protein GCM10010967_02290 [Dyadobacter beijingensis]|uniref:Outer membrane protein beta-barrel domain-containing protein n=1 Tax=Dyadobacter beijingensis TaxID=365489 RepID=A0ABQ2HCU4_9BACT|nr:porin family protein [Dyadobacter beijingensis]GGM74324.1 hypothetical protein GCM10010967_02290 [Dyadobacter beijingensis]